IIAIMTTSFTSSNTTTQVDPFTQLDILTLLDLLKKSQERYETAENKIIELQEKLDEQEKLNEQSPLINSNTVPLVLRPTQDNIDGFSISKIPLAKIFKLDKKAIREVKKTFGLLLDNHNIPKNCTISKIDPLHSQYKEYFGDNMWAYEESMKQVMQDRDKVNVINTDTDNNNSDSDNQGNYEEIRHILNNDTRLNNTIASINNENILLSDDEFFITKKHATKKIVPMPKDLIADKEKQINNIRILKERKVNKIVAAKLGDIGNKNISEYTDNDRPSKRTRSQRIN
ncbi:16288_t:CDS:2, partial [Dentiscutata erythropus]